jgi:hypothetical protein
MGWFTPEVEKRLFCETCKAHIEKATYTGTVMEEGLDHYTGMGNGFYAVKRLSFCARCKPDHDIVIVRRHRIDHIYVDTEARTLVDDRSKAQAANAIANAVIEALTAAAEERAALASADDTEGTPAAPDGDYAPSHVFPVQPMPSQPRAPIS